MRLGQLSTRGTATRNPIFKDLRPMLAAFAVATAASLAAQPALAEGDSDQWIKKVFASSQSASGVSNLGGPMTSSESRSRRAARSALTSSDDQPQSRRSKGTQVASLGTTRTDESPRRRAPVTGSGNVSWVASSGCLNGSLRSVITGLASSYGGVTVSSTCRSAGHNRSVGGAPRSMHLSGDAADFRIHGNVGAAYASLRSNGSVGGLKHYGGGLFHIDTGARRSW